MKNSHQRISRLNLQQFAKNPDFIYGAKARFLLTRVVPLCLVTTAPVEWVVSGSSWWPSALWMSGLCVPIWLAAFWIWNKGLLRYESASS